MVIDINTAIHFIYTKFVNYIEPIKNFKYFCKFLFLVPLFVYDKEPIVYYQDSSVIYFKAGRGSWCALITTDEPAWDNLKELIFDIKDRSEN